MSYKVGDKVRIKSTEWFDKKTMVDTEGYFRTSIKGLCPVMRKFSGTVCTISLVFDDGEYLLEETGVLRWTSEMFEGPVRKENTEFEKTHMQEDLTYEEKIETILSILATPIWRRRLGDNELNKLITEAYFEMKERKCNEE